MNRSSQVAAILLACSCRTFVSAASEDLRRTWTLYHSLDPKLGAKGYTKRGLVTLEAADNNEAKFVIENDDNVLSAADLDTALSSGWYQVKLIENGKTNNAEPVMTSVPACQLRLANFR